MVRVGRIKKPTHWRPLAVLVVTDAHDRLGGLQLFSAKALDGLLTELSGQMNLDPSRRVRVSTMIAGRPH